MGQQTVENPFQVHKFPHHSFRQLEPSTRIAMATQPRWYCSFGLALVAALLVPRAHVPPTWWQGGWRRPRVAREEVELLSPLAAMLMPEMPASELFRSFPSSDGEDDLEPSLTAYGVMKDPNAALYIHYDATHGKREGLNDDFQKRLLAYGPPGSRILHISHTKRRPLQDMVLCIKVGGWQKGDEASLSLVLNEIRKQVSHGLELVMCPESLKQLDSQNFTAVMHDFSASLKGATVNQNSLECRLFSRGFSPSSSSIMLKSARLSEGCAGAKFESRILYLLTLDQNQFEIREALETSFPALGDTLQKNLKQTASLSNLGLEQQQIGKVITISPSILSSSTLQNLEATVLWLLDLGLSHRQVVNVVGCCPEVLDVGKLNMEWLITLGMTKKQIRKAVCAFPKVLGCSIQEDLMPKLDWFSALGLTKNQIAKLTAVLPHVLAYSIEQKFKPKVEWFFQLGMAQGQAAKVIATFPQVLDSHVERNLKPKVAWLLQLGMTRGQVVKVITASPKVLAYSIEKNLRYKVEWFLQLGMTQRQVAKLIGAFPPVLGCSVEQNLKPKVKWLLELGMTQAQVAKLIGASPQFLGCSIERNLKPKVEWLLQLGMTRGQVVKVIVVFPSILRHSLELNLKHKVEWLLQTGMTEAQVAKVIAASPHILGCSIEQNLEPKVEWLLQLGMPQGQVAKLIAAFPPVLGCSVEQNLKRKVEWLCQLGITQCQVAKLVAVFPAVFGYSIEQNLKRKVEWLLHLGMSQEQVANVVLVFPQILSLSIEKNLEPKRALLQKVLGAQGALEMLLGTPQLFLASYLRFSARLRILVKRNETARLVRAMKMTEESFKRRFLDDL